jgi:CD2 antigen cytoplasmic tail-binding protein 2
VAHIQERFTTKMASRFSAARPKRAGEDFARTHHNDNDDADNKRAKFDKRNPSMLAPDAREDDAVLEADVIGGGRSTKRGAVNLDGYDSDSDNETFEAKAKSRKTGDIDINDQLDNYDAKSSGTGGTAKKAAAVEDDDGDDMFAADDDDDAGASAAQGTDGDAGKSDKKSVRFLDSSEIQGQENNSRAKSSIKLDEASESSDDEEDVALAIEEEGVDAEVGAGGLKRNAPKVEAFNLKEEMQEGQFDDVGNYVRKADDPDAVHDNWLEGLSKKDMKKAAAAHEKREAEARKRRLQDDNVLVSDLLRDLIVNLEPAETALEALARLGKGQVKVKKVPKWKLKKMNKGSDGMDVDTGTAEDPEQVRIKTAIHAITEAADKLLSRDHQDIYDQEREMLIREYTRETGDDWVEPTTKTAEGNGGDTGTTMWQFRWTDGRDSDATQGPFDSQMMKAWTDAGYFQRSVEFRRVDDETGKWTNVADFGY